MSAGGRRDPDNRPKCQSGHSGPTDRGVRSVHAGPDEDGWRSPYPTATPYRRDGHDPITEMQFGPAPFIRDALAVEADFTHRFITRPGRNGADGSVVGRWNSPSGSDPTQQLTDGMESAFEHLATWERNPQVLLARFWIALQESQPVVPGRWERDARRRR